MDSAASPRAAMMISDLIHGRGDSSEESTEFVAAPAVKRAPWGTLVPSSRSSASPVHSSPGWKEERERLRLRGSEPEPLNLDDYRLDNEQLADFPAGAAMGSPGMYYGTSDSSSEENEFE